MVQFKRELKKRNNWRRMTRVFNLYKDPELFEQVAQRNRSGRYIRKRDQRYKSRLVFRNERIENQKEQVPQV